MMLWRQCHGQPRNREAEAAALGRWSSSTGINFKGMTIVVAGEIGRARDLVGHAHMRISEATCAP
jgi:hypothetical protein